MSPFFKDFISSDFRFPPYNVLSLDKNKTALEFAVAGFRKEELEVSVKDGILFVTGKKLRDRPSDTTVVKHQGIASRDFSVSFSLGQHTNVVRSSFVDGILTVELQRSEESAKLIPIE